MPEVLKRSNYDFDIKQRILDLLRNTDGLTITEISKVLDVHYTTASKYLAVLEAEQKILRRDIGMAKLFRIKNGENGGSA